MRRAEGQGDLVEEANASDPERTLGQRHQTQQQAEPKTMTMRAPQIHGGANETAHGPGLTSDEPSSELWRHQPNPTLPWHEE